MEAVTRFAELKKQGRYEEAEPLAKIVLKYADKELTGYSIEKAFVLNAVGSFYYAQGRYEEAEPLFNRSLAIREKALSPDHPDVATSLSNLALLYAAQGRYADAEPLGKRSLEIYEKALGPDHPDVATSLNNLAEHYRSQGRYADAEPLYKRSLEIKKKAFRPDHPEVALGLNNLAALYNDQGRYAEAKPLYKRSLVIKEKTLGPEHPDVAIGLNNLASLYNDQGRYADAEPLLKRSLEIREKALGPDHPNVALSLSNLASNYQDQGRYEEAEPLYKRSLEIRETVLGPDHPDVAASLNNLAALYNDQGRYADTEPFYKRSLAIREKALSPDHPDVAQSLNNLAMFYKDQGRYADAEPLFNRSLEINEKALGPNHPNVATSLNNLAALYNDQGRYADAEPLFKRSFEIVEKALGPNHPDAANSLNNIASLYQDLGHYGEAEPLYKRSLEIFEKALGSDHPDVAANLNNLSELYRSQGRYAEAELLYKRSLEIYEVALGPDHPDVAMNLNNIAELYRLQGRYADAEPFYKRSLDIFEKALGPNHPRVALSLNNLAGLYLIQDRSEKTEILLKRSLEIYENALSPDHPDVAQSLNNLAVLFHDQGRYADAEPLYRRSLAIREKTLGPDHPDVVLSFNNLAFLYDAQSNSSAALSHIRRASSILRKKFAQTSGQKSVGSLVMIKGDRPTFVFHVELISKNPGTSEEQIKALDAESFEVAQLARVTSAGSAVSRMAARFAAGDDDFARLIRSRQDAVNRWRHFDKALIEAVSLPPDKRNEELEKNHRKELTSLGRRMDELDGQVVKRFPKYASLTSRQPLALSDTQPLLGPGEALVTYLVGEEESYLWVVRRDKTRFHRIQLKRSELEEAVKELRKGLDPTGITNLKQMPYDTTRAYELYRKLFEPAEESLEGIRHVMVVPDGALQSLPLGVLVTEEPQGSFTDFSSYRHVAWLAKKYAMTTLPSVSSLRALRTFAKRTRASRPFLGIGDPKLEGETGSGRGMKLASLFTSRGVADVESVRQLVSLPESAGELKALARTLGAGDDALILGTEATETRVKKEALKDYKVIAFATHGLIAGDIEGLAEPALVLTPPRKGTDLDDGLLTASEVAQLKLDADWVILSACNTASPDGTPGAEGLSGFAKAFFYAGSRALLVSHWPVVSDAAVKITTRMLSEAQKPGVGRAEAHRQAMLALMQDKDRPHYAHPLFWAPFVVVGEGGTATVN